MPPWFAPRWVPGSGSGWVSHVPFRLVQVDRGFAKGGRLRVPSPIGTHCQGGCGSVETGSSWPIWSSRRRVQTIGSTPATTTGGVARHATVEVLPLTGSARVATVPSVGTPPSASSAQVRRRMRNVRRRDTPAEVALRQELHRRGLRYRVDARPLKDVPRRADVVFRRPRVAVFVDGCFWHSCPVHGHVPKTNTEWWIAKLKATQRRDADTVANLEKAGWTVIRMWEHEDPRQVAERIHRLVKSRTIEDGGCAKARPSLSRYRELGSS